MVRKQIEVLEARRAALKVSELNFNSFFDYSFDRLEQICTEMTSRQSATRPIRPCCSRSTREAHMRRFSMRMWIRHCLTRHSSSLKWMQSRKQETVSHCHTDYHGRVPAEMRIKKTRKVLVIEEAWKAIASPLMAEYIKFMYKTARKFGLLSAW